MIRIHVKIELFGTKITISENTLSANQDKVSIRKNSISTCLWVLCVSGTLVVATVQAMNLAKPYYAYMKPRYTKDETFQFFAYGEKGFHFKAYNGDSCKGNPLTLWQGKQNTLAMLKGFEPNSPQGILLSMLQLDPDTCFKLCMSADVKHDFSLGLGGQYKMSHDFSIGAYLPIYKLSLSCPSWNKVGETIGCERTQTLLYDHFKSNVKNLGEGLDLGSWSRTGFGDLTFLLEWTRDFEQHKDVLKNVRLNCRCGPSFPTGKRSDEDLLIGFPFGHNGCTALIFGGSIELLLSKYIRTGVDVELTHLFGNTRDRRVKTDIEQTNFLLLKKVCSYSDPGLIQHFNLFLGFYDVCGGLYLEFDYEFYKHGENRLSSISNSYSNDIINSSVSLESWTAHHGIVKLGYDFAHNLSKDACVKPTLTAYARIPIDGTRVILDSTVGLMCSFDF